MCFEIERTNRSFSDSNDQHIRLEGIGSLDSPTIAEKRTLDRVATLHRSLSLVGLFIIRQLAALDGKRRERRHRQLSSILSRRLLGSNRSKIH